MIPTGQKLVELEKRLADYKGEDRIVSSEELAAEVKTIPARIFKTGVPSMDRLLGGVEPGELVIVTGPTGQGKTTLLMTLTNNLAGKENCAWFTLEVTPKQFLTKIMRKEDKMPLFYLPAKNTENNIDWLLERIIEAKVKFDTNIIFIDHLHQIFSIEKLKNNLSLEIGDVVAQIKKIAVDYGLAVFLIAHNKDREDNQEPQMRDIRDSGMICRLADTVMGIWRVPNDTEKDNKRMKECNETDNWAKVRIWKNRREGTLGAWFMEHKNYYLDEIEFDEQGYKIPNQNEEQNIPSYENEEL